MQEQINSEVLGEMVGKTYRVLCEGPSENENSLIGHTDGGVSVEFSGDSSLINSLVTVKIDSYNGILKGTII